MLKIISYKNKVFFVLTILFLALIMGSCGKSDASETITEEDSVSGESDNVIVEPEEYVMIDDFIYPGAEFLFEIPGIGGPMMPYRFYHVSGGDLDQIIDYYREQLPWFSLDRDEMLEGHRYLSLTYMKPLDELNSGDIEEIAQKGSELDGSLMGVEVAHSSAAEAGLTALTFAALGGYEDKIPSDSLIIVLTYFKNPYGE